MKRLKKDIVDDNQLSTPSLTDRPTPSTSFSTYDPTPSTPSHTTRSNYTYVYGVGILAVLAINVCVFLHITLLRPKIRSSSMKNRIN